MRARNRIFMSGLGAVCLAIAGCSGEQALTSKSAADQVELTRADVARSSDGAYQLTWTTSQPTHPVDVFMATSPTAAPDQRKQLVDNAETGKLVIASTSIPQGARPYFWVKAENGQSMMISERVLPLKGGRNFRDLGGYKTTTGEVVKWGVLYRSGVMANLTEDDHAYLKQLGIVQMCDFRSTEERSQEPTNWQAIGAAHYASVDYEDSGSSELRAVFTQPNLNGEMVRQAMISLYGTMVDRFVPHYTDMFARLVEGKAPLAFNCSAGKDRTGIAAALILTALGVPRETVLADYAMSDKIVDYEEAYTNAEEKKKVADGPYAFLAKLPAEVRAPLLKSDPAYLEAALNDIEKDYGSIEAYLDQKLGVSSEDIKTLRRLYLLQPDQT